MVIEDVRVCRPTVLRAIHPKHNPTRETLEVYSSPSVYESAWHR
jgi:hypothetical protein